MKIKYYISLFLLLAAFFVGAAKQSVYAQKRKVNYREDSLQFKMYTRLYISDRLSVDSVTVKKIFCDWCTDPQMDVLQQEAMRQSMILRHNPRYRKPGEHRLALYVRFSKDDFKKLNKINEGYE